MQAFYIFLVVLSGWLEMSWNDFNLKWNPLEYGNITKLHIQSSKIWIPGLYNKIISFNRGIIEKKFQPVVSENDF